jgi:hypothetical protein
MLEDHIPDLSGKYLQITLSTRSDDAYLIQDAGFDIQAGRMFVVGRISDAYSGTCWAKGAVVAIAWDTVERYVLFDSLEHFQEELRRWQAVEGAIDKTHQLFGH